MFALELSGCGSTLATAVDGDVASGGFQGKVFGGQQPVAGSTVAVYAMGSSGYGSAPIQLGASTTSDQNGNFRFPANAYTCPQSNTPVYLVATGGIASGTVANASLKLAASLGACSSAPSETVNINEVATAALAYSLAHFYGTSSGGFGGPSTTAGSVITYSLGLTNANTYTVPLLISQSTGTVKTSTSTLILPAAKLNSIANSLAACVNSAGETSTTETATACGQLFSYTNAPGSTTRPADTLQAAVNMALYPYQNVTPIYTLGSSSPPFPGLSSAPTDWTLPVSYKNTLTSVYGATTNYVPDLQIDANGGVFLPTPDGLGAISYVLPSTGSLTTNSGLCSSVGNSPLLHLAFDTENHLWFVCSNSVSILQANSTSALSNPGSLGYVILQNGGVNIYPEAIVVDSSDNIDVWGSASATGGTQDAGIYRFAETSSGTQTGMSPINNAGFTTLPYFLAANSFGEVAETTSNGSAMYWDIVTSAGAERTITFGSNYNSGVAGGYAEVNNGDTVGWSTGDNKECDYFSHCTAAAAYNGAVAPTGVAVDGNNTVWVANAGNHSISQYSFNAYVFAIANYVYDSTIAYAPTGIAIDQSGNVWFNNRGDSSGTTLTELVGAAGPTIQPIVKQLYGANYSGTMPTN